METTMDMVMSRKGRKGWSEFRRLGEKLLKKYLKLDDSKKEAFLKKLNEEKREAFDYEKKQWDRYNDPIVVEKKETLLSLNNEIYNKFHQLRELEEHSRFGYDWQSHNEELTNLRSKFCGTTTIWPLLEPENEAEYYKYLSGSKMLLSVIESKLNNLLERKKAAQERAKFRRGYDIFQF